MDSCKHHHFQPTLARAFLIGIILNTGFVVIEGISGALVNSLSLLADAAHNLSDVFGLIASWLGYHFSFRKPSERFTYGLGRVSIYATVLNGLLLCGSTLWIVWEALGRFAHPVEPIELIVGIVATIGVVINALTGWVLMRGQNDLNVKGSMIHMFADAGVSFGVVLSAVAIAWTGQLWIDPALSIIIAVVIFISGWPLLRHGVHLSLDAVPHHLDADAIRIYLQQHPDLAGVFDLHIWALGTTKTALTAHLPVRPDLARRAEDVVHDIHRELKNRFGVTHVTIQVEKDHRLCVDEHETTEEDGHIPL